MAFQRPRRRRAADRIIHGDLPSRDIECDYAVAPFDRTARDMDRKWGLDRLPELVSPETARKYGSALAHLNACITENDPVKTAEAAANCIRGMNAMDAEATARGAQPASREVWEVEVAGRKFGIMADKDAWQAIHDARPDLTLVSLREVAIALEAFEAGKVRLSIIKENFPGAEIAAVRPKTQLEEELNDEIPF